MIAIVDTGGANLASVRNALDRLGRTKDTLLTADPHAIARASHVIRPGVGAANDSMARLEQAGLIDSLRHLSQPTLGICLGMQLLFERSEEGDTPCLGLIPAEVRRFRLAPELTVPHMGWNSVRPLTDCPLLRGLPPESYFYFVHSFAAPLGPWAVAACDYGGEFAAVVQKGNYFGAQFHPEKSAAAGARLLESFLKL